MFKKKGFPEFIITVLCLFLIMGAGYAFTKTWDESAPDGADNPRSGDNEIRDFKFAVRERLAVDHDFAASEATTRIGYHTILHLSPVADLGTGAAGVPLLGSQFSTGGKAELVFTDEDDTDIYITDGGIIKRTSGQIVQVVNVMDAAVDTSTTAIPNDDTIPQITEGDEFMTLAITPLSSTNNLLVEVVVFGAPAGNKLVLAALFQDTTAGALAGGILQGADSTPFCMRFAHYMAAGTTSETTFRVRAGCNDTSTLTFNGASSARKFGGVMASSITITEIHE